MNGLSDGAIDIVNELHTERLDYNSEYLPLIDALNKLQEMEDLEEAGRLVRLPCKVGDTVWYYNPIDIIDEIVPITITDVKILGTGELELTYVNEYGERVYIYDNYFGKTVFLTREEAKAALKGAGK